MDQMTPEELKLKLNELVEAEFFPPIAVAHDGKTRLVVVPYEAYRVMHRASRAVLRTDELSEDQIRAIRDAKMPEGLEHLDDLLKDD